MMKVEKVALDNTRVFSSFLLDYIAGKKKLSPFYGRRPQVDSFGSQIADRKFPQENRELLVEVLSNQYAGLSMSSSVQGNINSLKDPSTFTLTTGHQLNVFTGPLYFIYKIVTVINACRQLKQQYPDNNFVPMYWMATEDHDFEEINHFHLFGKKYSWHSDQRGAVGRFSTAGIPDMMAQLPEYAALFDAAYKNHENLADAVRYYVNELFGSAGVVVLDADDRRSKAQFSEVIEDDLMNHRANDLVEQTSAALTELGYRAQVFPRAINFFYLADGIRERIVRESAGWKVLNTDLSFSTKAMEALLADEPEKFSPNVLMRPLYQEYTLPNLAYAGGPAELAYWMQLKDVFDYFKTPFPILMPRNFALIVNKTSAQKMDKFGYSAEDLFRSTAELQEAYLKTCGDTEVDLRAERNRLNQLFESLTGKAAGVDASLKGFVGAEWNRARKSLSNIEKRLKRAAEQRHETALNQITALKSKLFPEGGLQERHDNFQNFYLNNPELINQLLDALDPFDYSMHVLIEE